MNTSLELEPTVSAAARGDTDAFARLVDLSRNAVASIALARCRDLSTSEDVAQEAYLVAWRRLSELRNPASFLPWIRQITRYTANTWLRDRRSDVRFVQPEASGTDPAVLLEGAMDSGPGPEAAMLEGERERIFRSALDALPDETREVVILFYREEQSTRQVAELLDLSETAVRKRLQRARQALRREVLEKLAETAEKTAPKAAFTAALMSTLASAVPASAMALSAGIGAPSKLAGPKLFAWTGVMGAAFVASVAGIVLPLRHSWKKAIDDWDRSQVWTIGIVGVLAVILFMTTTHLPIVRGHWLSSMLVTFGYAFTIWYLTSVWHPRLLRRRLRARTDLDEEQKARQLRRMAWGTWCGHLVLFLGAGFAAFVGLAKAGWIDPMDYGPFRWLVTLLGFAD